MKVYDNEKNSSIVHAEHMTFNATVKNCDKNSPIISFDGMYYIFINSRREKTKMNKNIIKNITMDGNDVHIFNLYTGCDISLA